MGLPALTLPRSTALVVDDDPICRELVTSFLQQRGWPSVRQASDGSKAVREVEAIGAELGLVVSDINMPAVDGVEFLRWLADRGVDCPVLIVSGTAEPVARAARMLAVASGLDCVGLLAKPVRFDRLAELLPRHGAERTASAG